MKRKGKGKVAEKEEGMLRRKRDEEKGIRFSSRRRKRKCRGRKGMKGKGFGTVAGERRGRVEDEGEGIRCNGRRRKRICREGRGMKRKG